jgi:protein gp37
MAHRLGRIATTPQYNGLTRPEADVSDWDERIQDCRIGTKHIYNGTIRFVPEALAALKKWRKPRRVFVCSMGDLFHENNPDRDIMAVLNAMRDAPQHTYLLLSKRPGYMADALKLWARLAHTEDYGSAPIPDNWHVGVTVCNQQEADEKLPVLLSIPAKVRWVSAEPMLGPVDSGVAKAGGGMCVPEWVVCGGETGPGARPVDPRWVVDLYRQCREAGVPFFAKQFPKWEPSPYTLDVLTDGEVMARAMITRELPEEER